MIQSLSLEENNFSKYTFQKEKSELNSVMHVKIDQENPIIRLDGILEYNAKQVFETIVSTELMAQWFSERCEVNKMVEQLSNGAEIYVIILTFPEPINQLTVYYKRFLKADEKQ